MKCILILLIAGLLHASEAQRKACAFSVMKNFNPNRSTGMWYQYATYSKAMPDQKKCHSALLKKQEDGTMALMLQSQMYNNYPIMNYGKLTMTGPSRMNMEVQTMLGMLLSKTYFIMGTDYSSYLVVFTCDKNRGQPRHNPPRFLESLEEHPYRRQPTTDKVIWVFTRDRQPRNETVQKVYNLLKQQRFPPDMLKITDQKKCIGDTKRKQKPKQHQNPKGAAEFFLTFVNQEFQKISKINKRKIVTTRKPTTKKPTTKKPTRKMNSNNGRNMDERGFFMLMLEPKHV